jgi:HTH-type transcriptional regulator, glycine betaine synthesis regulator
MMMSEQLTQLKKDFTEGLSQISKFWGFPKGMGAIFAVLYLSPAALSLDELVEQTGLTKGAISTNVRALARMGLVRPSTKLGDRKDYYEAETDFYKSIRAILKERQNSEFDSAVQSVRETLEKLEAGVGIEDEAERQFMLERVRALQSFFDALDGLVRAVVRLEGLGITTVEKVLSILK